jgi:hypothetical protein
MTHTDRSGSGAERSSSAMRWPAASLLLAFALMAGACGGATQEGPEATGGSNLPSSSTPTPTSTPIPSLPSGALEPGMFVVSAIDPDFDASHRITISVPGGYQGLFGWGILKNEGRQWVSASVVGSVYADACHWNGTLLDPPVGANFDALVAALANQLGTRASTPTDVTLAGFAGKRMELTVPDGINLADCDNGQFRFWTFGLGESDYRNTPFTGEHGQLWILDGDGVPLVIEAAWPIGASAQVQAELTQMVESIRIDPL